MRLLVLKIVAVALTLGVLALVVHASQRPAGAAITPLTPQPSTSASATPAEHERHLPGSNYGVLGPATKADPHTMRRAAEALQESAREAVAPAPSSSASAR